MQTRIKGYTFTISEPFQPGCVITKGEAQALNNLRVENIANSLRDRVDEAVAQLAPGEILSQATLDSIQARITAYDIAYQFLEKHQPRVRLGDIEAAAREVARERVEAAQRAQELQLSEEELEAQVLANEGLPAVLEEARVRVAARRKALTESLSDL